MKTKLIILIALAAFSAPAFAANYLVQYNESLKGLKTDLSMPAFDWLDHVTPGGVSATGGAARTSSGTYSFNNWGTTRDESKFLGFTVTAETGYQLNITDFQYAANARATFGVSSFQWGYRIDSDNDGIYEQGWTFGTLHTAATDPNYTLKVKTDTWDMADFSTTGTVQFGLFATGDDATKDVDALRGSMYLNGNVTPAAVPEASSALLGLVGALSLLRRRR